MYVCIYIYIYVYAIYIYIHTYTHTYIHSLLVAPRAAPRGRAPEAVLGWRYMSNATCPIRTLYTGRFLSNPDATCRQGRAMDAVLI